MNTRSITAPNERNEEWEEEEGEEEFDEDGEDTSSVDDDDEYVYRSAKRALKALEEELGTTKRLLRRNADILICNATFEGPTTPRTVDTVARIKSPTGNKAIKVHFSYNFSRSVDSVERSYTLGYKVIGPGAYTASAEMDLEAFEERAPVTKYSNRGWRGISYAFYDNDGSDWPTWKRIMDFSVNVTYAGLVEAHEALWGPLGTLPPGASAADLAKRRRALIRTLRMLLASVGIEYTIACEDGEIDSEPGGNGRKQIVWMLEDVGDRWLARGVRKACGFQLERDPDEEMKGIRNREEEAQKYNNNDSDEEDYGSEEYSE